MEKKNYISNPKINSKDFGVFENPVGLAAGFDKMQQ